MKKQNTGYAFELCSGKKMAGEWLPPLSQRKTGGRKGSPASAPRPPNGAKKDKPIFNGLVLFKPISPE